jgi:hypothetical protein
VIPPVSPLIPAESTTETGITATTAATIYAYVNQGELETLKTCQIKCTVNKKYSATIGLDFNYADFDNVIRITPSKTDIPAYNRDSGTILSWWKDKTIQLTAESIDSTFTLEGLDVVWSILEPTEDY